MRKLTALALSLATGGLLATSAAANHHEEEESRLVVKGRQTVWVRTHTQEAEKPYALTGEVQATERSEAAPKALAPRGRAGYQRR